MHSYRSVGLIPRKRHIVLRRGDGAIHYEELIGNRGFSGPSSLLYRLRIPTAVKSAERIRSAAPEPEESGALRNRHFESSKIICGKTTTLGRVPLLFNSDVVVSLARPSESDAGFYRNGQADETIYVAEGAGVVESAFGDVPYRAGDYVVIPRGITHRVVIDKKVQPQRYLIVESGGYIRAPKRYRGDHGQLLEGAPYSERDFRGPENLKTHDATGEFEVVVKQNDALTRVIVLHHPFDVVGWDGVYYPVAFSIHDFEPKVARVHLPPPVHQTFEAEGLVICSFCPRPYDFHPDAIPAPYSHSNAMSDEVLFYASAEFMSRKGIAFGSITLHPDGLPHGPQPGRTEASLGAKWTDELAVMIDTFRPLKVAKGALDGEDPNYVRSWTLS